MLISAVCRRVPILAPSALVQIPTDTRHEDAPNALPDSTDRQAQVPSGAVHRHPVDYQGAPLPGPRIFNRRVLTGLKAKPLERYATDLES